MEPSSCVKIADMNSTDESKKTEKAIVLELTQGYVTLVDANLPEHLQWILNVSWYAHKSRCGIYARNRKHGFLHRVLMKTPSHLQTDHVNGDHLDNRLDNLQNVMPKTNMRRMWQQKKEREDETVNNPSSDAGTSDSQSSNESSR